MATQKYIGQFKWKMVTVKSTANEVEKLLNEGWDVASINNTQSILVYMMRKPRNAQ